MDPPRPPPKFTARERVLFFHGYLIYEGKLLKSEFRNHRQEWAYRIHCPGRDQNCDEWIYERRVLKYCDMSLLGLLNPACPGDGSVSLSAVGYGPGSSTTPVAAEDSSGGRGITKIEPKMVSLNKGPKDGAESESRNQPGGISNVHIIIPKKLNLILIEDWNAITMLKRLAVLPARVPIDRIFKDYAREKDGDQKQAALELCRGLRKHFTSLIDSELLYPLEIEQFQVLLTKIEKEKMAEYYGLPHLMRLCGKFSETPDSELRNKAVTTLQREIRDFFGFLVERSDTYYSMEAYYM